MTEQYLGPYRLESKLGSGGMGSVFRAVHIQSGAAVAVKLIAEQVADSERFRRRFAVEVETLKKLDHPNIVRLIGYGEEQGRLFYSMDIVEGPSLQQYLKKNKRLGWQETLKIGIDICSALKHAHDLGVIHRDLKPANLLMAPDGRIQLVDFGIAKMFGASDCTVAGSVLGTADYMAPEQAGEGKITTRTDLYALGSVLYACLTGRPPFGGKSVTTVIEALRREPPVPLDLIVPETPEELSELVHQLLEKRPESRPPTALAVGNRLRATKRGLEAREAQTNADPSGQTQLDDATHSDDLDVDEQYLIKDVHPLKPAPAAGLGRESGAGGTPPLGTHDVQTLDVTIDSVIPAVPQRPSTVESVGGKAAASSSSSSSETGPLEAVRDTTFRTVDESERRSGTLSAAPEQTSGHWISVAAWLALLVSVLAVTVYLLRSPSADQLYAAIDTAEVAGNTAVSKSKIEAFLRQYPEDPRAAEVRQIAESHDVQSTIRRLRLAALRAGGVAQLAPPQQAFLEAVMMRDQDPNGAKVRLQHWLAVYGQEGLPRSRETLRLAKLAEREIDALTERRDGQAQSSSQELIKAVQWAGENLSKDKQREFYDGVIAMHGSEPWAAEPVEMAREALRAIQD